MLFYYFQKNWIFYGNACFINVIIEFHDLWDINFEFGIEFQFLILIFNNKILGGAIEQIL